jgi:hypothetical protein
MIQGKNYLPTGAHPYAQAKVISRWALQVKLTECIGSTLHQLAFTTHQENYDAGNEVAGGSGIQYLPVDLQTS